MLTSIAILVYVMTVYFAVKICLTIIGFIAGFIVAKKSSGVNVVFSKEEEIIEGDFSKK